MSAVDPPASPGEPWVPEYDHEFWDDVIDEES